MISEIKAAAARELETLIKVRRHLHRHPELSFKEFETSRFLIAQLKAMEIGKIKQIDKTGILATIEGKSSGNTILLRADMDALPISEQNRTGYESINPGVMHACGHDAHMACLLLAAKILNQLKDRWAGAVKVLFQPAEERIPGGAQLMIKNGVLDHAKPSSAIGQHVMPSLPAGKVGFRRGEFMASMDEIYLIVKGKGGHAAMPETTVDPVMIASHIIVASQQLISRNNSPKTPSVLSFGKITGLGATNIIPDEVRIEGTFRTLDETWRFKALTQFALMVKSIAKGMGGTCEVEILNGYPHLHNEKTLTERLKIQAEVYVGKNNVVTPDIWMAAEDFAYYSQLVPSSFYLLGVQNKERGIDSGLHTPTFDLDEKALETGAGLMAWLAVSELNEVFHTF